MKSTNAAAPHNPERKTINFGMERDGSKSDNGRQPNDNVSAQMINPSESAAFDLPRMSKLFKN